MVTNACMHPLKNWRSEAIFGTRSSYNFTPLLTTMHTQFDEVEDLGFKGFAIGFYDKLSSLLQTGFRFPSSLLQTGFRFPSSILQTDFGFPSSLLQTGFGFPSSLLQKGFRFLSSL